MMPPRPLDVTQLQFLADIWYEDFIRRCPARITATGEMRIRILQLLHQLDAVRPQRFTRGPNGALAFRLFEVARALGLAHQVVLEEARDSSLVAPHLLWLPFSCEDRPEPAVTMGGLVMLVAVIASSRFPSPERRAWHVQRRELAFTVLHLVPDDDDPDTGAQIDRFVQFLKPVSQLH